MAITSAPQRSGGPAQHLQPTLIGAVIAVLVLGAIGVALALRGGGSSPGSGIQGSGSGQLSAAGTATRLDVTLTGDGQAQLSQLSARDVHAVLTGAGLIQVTATSSLNAAVPGTGLIMYTGNPSQVVTSVTGTGTIVHA